jgi:hypothetical protein
MSILIFIMKQRLLCAIFFCLFIALHVQSQNISIKNTDVSAYPIIRSTIQTSASAIQASDIKVLEDRKELTFDLKQAVDSTAGKSKAVFILIEASGFTHGRAVENFKIAVNDALSRVGPSDKVNVGYFGKANQNGKTLNILNTEFTVNTSSLKKDISAGISTTRDTTYVADVYKAIYEALDFMIAKQSLPPDKRLVVLSAAINNSKSPIKAEDCIEKAQRLRIPIYTVTYKTGNRYAPDNFVRLSDRTNGKTTLAKTLDEIKTAAKDFIGGTSSNNAAIAGQYIIEFTTANPKSGRLYQYEIRYNEQRLAATYTAPREEGGSFKNYGLYIFLIVALIGGGIAWLLYQAKQKKLAFETNKDAEQEALLRKAEVRERSVQNEVDKQIHQKSGQQPVSQKRDLKRTMIAGGGAAPLLVVSAGSFSQTFSIDRPQHFIGRAAGNDIVIPEATVSGKHASISKEEGIFFISDLGSTNGTLVNNMRIQGKQLIKNGDLIQMGAAQLKFQV